MGHRNLIVAQGGGPTVVMNNSLRGIVEQALREEAVDGVYGARYGLEGVLKGNFVDLGAERRDVLESLQYTPGAVLGSSRAKLSDEDFGRILGTIDRVNARYFLFIGGNGSMAACQRVHTRAVEEGVDVRVLGVPMTIDNDIKHTDHCPGFGSAARYYSVSVREVGRDVETLPTPVSVFETMGRSAGWLAATTGLARRTESDAPHLIYVPEKPLRRDQFLEDVQRVYDALGWVSVAVSEGVENGADVPPSASRTDATVDDFGRGIPGDVGVQLANLVAEELGLRARSEKPGLCGRASVAHASEVDLEEAYQLGRTGVQWVVEGTRGTMIALQRNDGSDYECTFTRAELDQVAGAERSLPAHFVNEEGNGVTEAFRDYASPLIGDPLPRYPRLANRPVDAP